MADFKFPAQSSALSERKMYAADLKERKKLANIGFLRFITVERKERVFNPVIRKYVYGDCYTRQCLQIDDTAYDSDGKRLMLSAKGTKILSIEHGIPDWASQRLVDRYYAELKKRG